MDEKKLIRELRKGNELAFRHLVESNQVRVFNTALGFMHNTEDADDIAQEVFVEAFTSIHKFKGGSLLSTWLYRITVNKCLDLIRARNRQKRSGQEISLNQEPSETGPALQIPDVSHPGLDLENKELAAVLFAAIDLLPENQRIAFTLSKLEDQSYKDIATIMETSLSAVESLIHRAKGNLRKILKDYYENYDA